MLCVFYPWEIVELKAQGYSGAGLPGTFAKTSMLSKTMSTAAKGLTPLEVAPLAALSNSRWTGMLSPVAKLSPRPAVSPHHSYAPLFAHLQSRSWMHKDSEMVWQPAGPISFMDMKESWIQFQMHEEPPKTESQSILPRKGPENLHQSSLQEIWAHGYSFYFALLPKLAPNFKSNLLRFLFT